MSRKRLHKKKRSETDKLAEITYGEDCGQGNAVFGGNFEIDLNDMSHFSKQFNRWSGRT